MSLTPTVTKIAAGGWRLAWSGGTPPYSLWVDGREVLTTSDTTADLELGGYELTPPDVEVLSSGEVGEQATHPPYARIQWRGNTGALGYRVQELVGTAWVDRGLLIEDGRGYYTWESEVLEDGSPASFRVHAIDPAGNEGSALTFQLDVIRNPATPAVGLELTGGDVVVSS